MGDKPPALSEGYKSNFETLKRAFAADEVALVSAIRKSDQQPVALVCAINRGGEDATVGPEIMLVPLAVLIEGDPYELFEDPTKE